MITVIIHKNDCDITIPDTVVFDVSDYIKTNTIIIIIIFLHYFYFFLNI
jgi:hypothetical protein